MDEVILINIVDSTKFAVKVNPFDYNTAEACLIDSLIPHSHQKLTCLKSGVKN